MSPEMKQAIVFGMIMGAFGGFLIGLLTGVLLHLGCH